MFKNLLHGVMVGSFLTMLVSIALSMIAESTGTKIHGLEVVGFTALIAIVTCIIIISPANEAGEE